MLFFSLILILINHFFTNHGFLSANSFDQNETPCEQKRIVEIGIASRLAPCGGIIDCGDSHVIVIKNVTNDESLVEMFQIVCNHNHSCDLAVASEQRSCQVEYYCLNDTFSSSCTHEYFSGIYMKYFLRDNSFPQCYRSDGESSMGVCSFYPPTVPRNNWLLLQATQPVTIKRLSNSTNNMQSFRNYNFPVNLKTSNPNDGIQFNCEASIWLLYMVSNNCDEDFDDLFLEADKSDDLLFSQSMYSESSDDANLYNSLSFSSSTSSGVASYTDNPKDNRWISSRDFILKVTAGIAGSLTLITFSVCLSVLIKKSSKKSHHGRQVPPLPTEINSDSFNEDPFMLKPDLEASEEEKEEEEEDMYFVIEPEKNRRRKEEENTYNSIDELLPKIHPDTTVPRRLYNPLKQCEYSAKKPVSTIIEEDMYDLIPEDNITEANRVSNNVSARESRISELSNSSWKRKPCQSVRGSSSEETQSNVSLIPNEEWVETSSNIVTRKGFELYDTIQQKDSSVPDIESTDSESDSDAIYEQVDELRKKSNSYGSVRPPLRDIYETVDDSPMKMGRCSTFLPPRNESHFSQNKTMDLNRLNNGNINEENTATVQLKDDCRQKPSSLDQNPNDRHIYAHLKDGFD